MWFVARIAYAMRTTDFAALPRGFLFPQNGITKEYDEAINEMKIRFLELWPPDNRSRWNMDMTAGQSEYDAWSNKRRAKQNLVITGFTDDTTVNQKHHYDYVNNAGQLIICHNLTGSVDHINPGGRGQLLRVIIKIYFSVGAASFFNWVMKPEGQTSLMK